MGEPSGGSLTADQWLIAATVVCPILVSTCASALHATTDKEQLPEVWKVLLPSKSDEAYVIARRVGQIEDELKARQQAISTAKKAAAGVKHAAKALKAAALEEAVFKRKKSGRSLKRTVKGKVLALY